VDISSSPADGRQRLRVGVIGSARLGEESPAWAVGEELGRLLGAAGCTVVTGGYGGLMAAVSKGAASAGGHVIGLPMRTWPHLVPNEWNRELEWADGYPSRLASLLSCQAVVALDGGVGTLSELAVIWAAAQTEADPAKLVVVGERWRRLLNAFGDYLVADSGDLSLIQIADSPAAALRAVLSACGATPGGRSLG
jgi:uncharacterized protein (TIGR00725 family)